MDITMVKSDPDYIRINEICGYIAHIVYEHIDLLDKVCLLLQSITKATNSITREVEEFFLYVKCDVLENDLEAFHLLKNEFINYYELIQSFEFDSELRVHNDKEYKIYKLTDNTEKIKVFRGVMFEHIVSAFVKPRYVCYSYETGCQVKINGQLVKISYGKGNERHKVTIDIAGWNPEDECGEFYECKIHPFNFKEENLQYLMHLHSILMEHAAYLEVGLVTADTTENAISKIHEMNINIADKIKCIGHEKLKELKTFAFPISA